MRNSKTPQAGARIHQIVQQHPPLRVEDVFARVLGRIGLVHRRHHLVGDTRESRLAAVVVVDHTRGRRRMGFNDVIDVAPPRIAHRFGFVVVEHQVRARHVGHGLVVMSRPVMAILPSACP